MQQQIPSNAPLSWRRRRHIARDEVRKTILRRFAENGYIKDAEGRVEDWISENASPVTKQSDRLARTFSIAARGNGFW